MHEERSESLTCLLLFVDVRALDDPGYCGRSVHLRFPCYRTKHLCKVCELLLGSFCYLVQSGILSLMYVFYLFKTFLETFVGWSNSSINITMSSWSFHFFVYSSYKLENKKVANKFPLAKSGRSKFFRFDYVRLLSLFTINVSEEITLSYSLLSAAKLRDGIGYQTGESSFINNFCNQGKNYRAT